MALVIVTSVNSYLPIYDSSSTFKVVSTYLSTPLFDSWCEQGSEGFYRTPCLYQGRAMNCTLAARPVGLQLIAFICRNALVFQKSLLTPKLGVGNDPSPITPRLAMGNDPSPTELPSRSQSTADLGQNQGRKHPRNSPGQAGSRLQMKPGTLVALSLHLSSLSGIMVLHQNILNL